MRQWALVELAAATFRRVMFIWARPTSEASALQAEMEHVCKRIESSDIPGNGCRVQFSANSAMPSITTAVSPCRVPLRRHVRVSREQTAMAHGERRVTLWALLVNIMQLVLISEVNETVGLWHSWRAAATGRLASSFRKATQASSCAETSSTTKGRPSRRTNPVSPHIKFCVRSDDCAQAHMASVINSTAAALGGYAQLSSTLYFVSQLDSIIIIKQSRE